MKNIYNKRDRIILHSDLNCFYASVELLLHPELRGYPVAVGGSEKDRHGIILTKSEEAKKYGIKTGMVNRDALKLCPNLIIIPPHYEEYIKFSKLVRSIYARYTGRIEPFGMDECWLDVTGEIPGEIVANEIRETIKKEIGLTVSIGVSYNKIFAKLGSDMKKPDAVTVITRENFREKVHPLPISDMIYCGPKTTVKLNNVGIFTLGQLAEADPIMLRKLLGVHGLFLHLAARGEDTSAVSPAEHSAPVKSVGHGVTTSADLHNNDEVKRVIYDLSWDVERRLRSNKLLATAVTITVRDKNLIFSVFTKKLKRATSITNDLAEAAFIAFKSTYSWDCPVRAVTITAIDLISSEGVQIGLFDDVSGIKKKEKLSDTIWKIKGMFGNESIKPALLLGDNKTPTDKRELAKMPRRMFVTK